MITQSTSQTHETNDVGLLCMDCGGRLRRLALDAISANKMNSLRISLDVRLKIGNPLQAKSLTMQ